MEVMLVVQSGTLLHALRMLLIPKQPHLMCGCHLFASHFPSIKIQHETKVRLSTPVADLGMNTAAVAVLVEFTF
jgi:hypothetical protein